MNAITMLTDDHRDVKRLLDELEPTTERGVRTRHELFDRIQELLRVHEIIEEEIFYPALRDHPKTREMALEGYEGTTSSTRSSQQCLPASRPTTDVGRQGQAS